MKPMTEIHLFGSLRKMVGEQEHHPLKINIEGSMPIIEFLKIVEIEPEDVQLAMINYKATSEYSTVQPGDRLSLFPREYPIFADWKDLRFP